jgi:hypothetical protein
MSEKGTLKAQVALAEKHLDQLRRLEMALMSPDIKESAQRQIDDQIKTIELLKPRLAAL